MIDDKTMSEDDLRAERGQSTMSAVAAAHYKSERDIHFAETEVFVKHSTAKIEEQAAKIRELEGEVDEWKQAASAEADERRRAHAEIARLREALEYFQDAQCDCSIEERLSGHLTGCWKPEAEEKIRQALARPEGGGPLLEQLPPCPDLIDPKKCPNCKCEFDGVVTHCPLCGSDKYVKLEPIQGGERG